VSDYVPTFADLCNAIAEGQLTASVDGSMYEVNALELRRYLNKFRPLPLISTSSVAAQSTFPHADTSSSSWSGSARSSVA
jgi:hypothetical protein